MIFTMADGIPPSVDGVRTSKTNSLSAGFL